MKIRDFSGLENGTIKVQLRKEGIREYTGSFLKKNGQMSFLGYRIYGAGVKSSTIESLGCGTEIVEFSCAKIAGA